MMDKGNLANPAVALRDIIRGEADKRSLAQNQVALGVVQDVGDGTNVSVLFDGFSAGGIRVTWMSTTVPVLGMRVVLVGLSGGQSWYVVGVQGGDLDHDFTQYSLVDGSRPFTAEVAGVTPTFPASLTTKQYVDDEIDAGVAALALTLEAVAFSGDHADLLNTGADGHPQYLLRSELGTGGGVDADLLDGQEGAFYAAAADYLALAGGAMAGSIDMDHNSLTGVRDFYAGTTPDGDLIWRTSAGTIVFFYDDSLNAFRFQTGIDSVRFPDGTEAVPGINFEGDTDTGARRVGTNMGALVAGAGDVFRWTSTAKTFFSGTDASWSGFTAINRVALHGEAGIVHSCRASAEAAFFGRTGTDGAVIRFDKSGVQVGSISLTGAATAYNTTSDERLKDNIIDMEGCLDIVDQMRTREFDWRSGEGHVRGALVAQEVAQIFPEAVTVVTDTVPELDEEGAPVLDENGELVETEVDLWMVDYGRLSAVLAGAMREFRSEVQDFRAEVNSRLLSLEGV